MGRWIFISLFLSPLAFASVSQKCLDPLTEALGKAEQNGKKPLTYVVQAPAECQYFTVGELEPELRSRIFKFLKEHGRTAGLDTKLTEVFGLLKLSPLANANETKIFDPCEALFFDLFEKKKKFTKSISQTPDRKECFHLSSQFLNELKKFPSSCDNPIEVTSREFRDLFQQLGEDYQRTTQKQLPIRLAFAFNAIKDLTSKTLNGKCGNLP